MTSEFQEFKNKQSRCKREGEFYLFKKNFHKQRQADLSDYLKSGWFLGCLMCNIVQRTSKYKGISISN
jgi:hypothetical protein